MVNDTGGFSLRPEAIPELKRAYTDALRQVQPLLADLDGLAIAQPAMTDQASQDFRAAFNRFTAEGPGSVREGLAGFARQLRDTVETLGAIEHAYARDDSDTAAALTRRLQA
jgi:hypothetical protein